ncbi:MAG: DNA-processing protein DprA [Myxococcota bacterium]|nr:DNA-processing protein DprA [Myxococcota bacterium]
MLARVYDIETSPFFKRFTQLKQPPKRLHCRGDFVNERGLDSCGPIVGIVGTRKPSEVGRQIAYQLGFDIASMGGVVVSGGALGIDSAAHRGCIEGGGLTWVVLPSTVEHPLPRSNRRLFSEVLSSGGALLSEFEKPPNGKYAFCTRNRIIAALCDLLIVVEAYKKSGTFYTIETARYLERPIFAVPWRMTDAGASVFRQLVLEGATPLGTLRELVQELSLPTGTQLQEPSLPTENALERQIMSILTQHNGLFMEELVYRLSAYPRTDIISSVVTLEMRTLIRQDAFGILRLSPSILGAKL